MRGEGRGGAGGGGGGSPAVFGGAVVLSQGLGLRESYARIREDACGLETARDVVVVSGPDARAWLQGQVSQDLDALGVGQCAETLVLSPQGKVDAYCRATVLADEVVLLDTATGYGEALSQRLRRFRLRVKADLETGTVSCLQVRGPASAASIAALGLGAVPASAYGPGDNWVIAVQVNWPGFAGVDVLKGAGAPCWPKAELVSGDPAAFEAARIEAGVPTMGLELTDKTIPHEAGNLVAHAVSLTKGCYTGQELVARLDARGGNVAWRLRGVVLEADSSSRVGAPLLAGDREVGRVTSLAWSPGHLAPVGLAYVRRDVVPPFVVTVASGPARAEIRELPL